MNIMNIMGYFLIGIGIILWTFLGAMILTKIVGPPRSGTEDLMVIPSFFWPICLGLYLIWLPLVKACEIAADFSRRGK